MASYARIVPLFAVLFLLPAPVRADTWGSDPAKEHPGTAPNNLIIRWCADQGEHERYASANIELSGYHPCGELKTPIACDPSGRRMIANSDEIPAAYKDCAVGPRIVVERKTPIDIQDFHDPLADGSTGADPLSSKERADLAGEIGKAKREQSMSMDSQVQQMLDGVLQSLINLPGFDPMTGNKAGSRNVPSKQRRFSDQQVDEMIRYVDPQYQRKLERILRSQ